MAEELNANYWYARGIVAGVFLMILVGVVYLYFVNEAETNRWLAERERTRQVMAAEAHERAMADADRARYAANADNSTQSTEEPVSKD